VRAEDFCEHRPGGLFAIHTFVLPLGEVYNPVMMPNYEQILSQAMSLPAEDRQRLVEALSESAPAKPEYKADPKDEQAMKWINEHAKEYPGEWLALDGYRLLAHGKILREVTAAAKAQGIDLPLLHLVEPPRERPYIRS